MTAPDWRATYARERAKRVARLRGECAPIVAGGHERAGKGCWRDSAKRVVSWCRNNRVATDTRPTVSKREAKATPPEFRDVLLAIAASCRR